MRLLIFTRAHTHTHKKQVYWQQYHSWKFSAPAHRITSSKLELMFSYPRGEMYLHTGERFSPLLCTRCAEFCWSSASSLPFRWTNAKHLNTHPHLMNFGIWVQMCNTLTSLTCWNLILIIQLLLGGCLPHSVSILNHFNEANASVFLLLEIHVVTNLSPAFCHRKSVQFKHNDPKLKIHYNIQWPYITIYIYLIGPVSRNNWFPKSKPHRLWTESRPNCLSFSIWCMAIFVWFKLSSFSIS